MKTMTANEFGATHAGVYTADVNGWTSYRDGMLWYPIKPNPLPWYRRMLGHVVYVSEDGKLVREGYSTAESHCAGV